MKGLAVLDITSFPAPGFRSSRSLALRRQESFIRLKALARLRRYQEDTAPIGNAIEGLASAVVALSLKLSRPLITGRPCFSGFVPNGFEEDFLNHRQ